MSSSRLKTCTWILSLFLLVAGAALLCVSCTGGQSDQKEHRESVSHADVLCAVPSDAAVVICFQNSRTGLDVFTDPGSCYGTLISGSSLFRRFVAALHSEGLLKNQHMAVSLHFSGTIEPLMVVDFGKSSDTTSVQRQVLALAESSRISSSMAHHGSSRLLLLSASETLVKSSARHLNDGSSILIDKSFASIVKDTDARDVMFFSNSYAGKLMSAFLARPLQKYSSFVKNAADWTAFDINEVSARRIRMKGRTVCGEGLSHYMHVLRTRPDGECRFMSVLPEKTWSALSRNMDDLGAYYKAYTDYLDASSSLQQHQRNCDSVKARAGMYPLRWAETMGIREVARADWYGHSGESCSAILLRTAKPRKDASDVTAFEWSDAVTLLFGDQFRPAPDAVSTAVGEWTVIGDEASVSDWLVANDDVMSLGDLLSDLSVTVPGKDCSMAFFFSLDGVSRRLESYFRPVLADDVESTLEGLAHEPVVVTYGRDGFNIEIARITASDRAAAAASVASMARKEQVDVPAGPFPVINSATGDTNYFYQNSRLSLCLKDQNGKGIWGIPFHTPVCGSAVNVDFYCNGKLQILFAAGSRLYILDRTGRFLAGFPVDLGREVLVGPVVSGEPGSYRLMILHKDNTVGMYLVDGSPAPEWEGISAGETILGMPEKMSLGDRDAWVVRTMSKTLLFPENGGQVLYDRDDKKAISRDSELEVSPKGALTVTCVDGKKRKIKL